ncbi:TPA: hypothetical protein ACSCX2_004457 [Aeromonas veronii]
MDKKEKVYLVILFFVMIGVAPLIINQKRISRADVAMTAYIADAMPLKYKGVNYFNIKEGGVVCYQFDEYSDCFNPLIKSPQYSDVLHAANGVNVSKKMYWWIHYGDLLVEIPSETKNAYSKEEVKNALGYVISVLRKELDEKEKIKESWREKNDGRATP